MCAVQNNIYICIELLFGLCHLFEMSDDSVIFLISIFVVMIILKRGESCKGNEMCYID